MPDTPLLDSPAAHAADAALFAAHPGRTTLVRPILPGECANPRVTHVIVRRVLSSPCQAFIRYALSRPPPWDHEEAIAPLWDVIAGEEGQALAVEMAAHILRHERGVRH